VNGSFELKGVEVPSTPLAAFGAADFAVFFAA